MAFCTNCGTKLPEGASFCTECGTRVEAYSVPPQPIAPPQPVAYEQPAVYEQSAVYEQPQEPTANPIPVPSYMSQDSGYDPRLGRPGFTMQAGGEASGGKGKVALYIILGFVVGFLVVGLLAGAVFALFNRLNNRRQESQSLAVTQPAEAVLPSSGSALAPTADDAAAWWEGDWYGWWVITQGYGEWEDYTDNCWDACAKIKAYDSQTGLIQIWDEDCAEDESIISLDVFFRDGTGSAGRMISESGYFWDCEIGYADWIVDPEDDSATGGFADMICIRGTYTDTENSANGFDYMFFLRPWGMEWEDVRSGDTSDSLYDDMMPLRYDEWYVPLLRAGVEEAPFSMQ